MTSVRYPTCRHDTTVRRADGRAHLAIIDVCVCTRKRGVKSGKILRAVTNRDDLFSIRVVCMCVYASVACVCVLSPVKRRLLTHRARINLNSMSSPARIFPFFFFASTDFILFFGLNCPAFPRFILFCSPRSMGKKPSAYHLSMLAENNVLLVLHLSSASRSKKAASSSRQYGYRSWCSVSLFAFTSFLRGNVRKEAAAAGMVIHGGLMFFSFLFFFGVSPSHVGERERDTVVGSTVWAFHT